MSGEGRVVCVTGGAGFIASWLIKLLLLRGYTVKATVRDPSQYHLSCLGSLCSLLSLKFVVFILFRALFGVFRFWVSISFAYSFFGNLKRY